MSDILNLTFILRNEIYADFQKYQNDWILQQYIYSVDLSGNDYGVKKYALLIRRVATYRKDSYHEHPSPIESVNI